MLFSDNKRFLFARCIQNCSVLLRFNVHIKLNRNTPGPKKNYRIDSFPFYSGSALDNFHFLYLLIKNVKVGSY